MNQDTIKQGREWLEEFKQAEFEIGKWLSAAMDDDSVCAEMKLDITRWFNMAATYEPFIKELLDAAEQLEKMRSNKGYYYDEQEPDFPPQEARDE